MLIEQAFYCLPEILVGRHYSRQSYEGGVVSAFSMALLQEFNGRNVPNPIAAMQAEKPYRDAPFIGLGKKASYRRADLHVDLARIKSSSSSLARYGWRHSNWIEAKFFRPPRTGASPTTTNVALLFSDLVRLVTLVPVNATGPVNIPRGQSDEAEVRGRLDTGRYLLHLYEGDRSSLVSSTRRASKNGVAGTRGWLDKLYVPGRVTLTNSDCDVSTEGNTFLNVVGVGLKDIKMDLAIETLRLAPVGDPPMSRGMYECVMNRIDEFRIEIPDGTWCHVDSSRVLSESVSGAAAQIAEFVGARAGLMLSDLEPMNGKPSAANAKHSTLEEFFE